MLRHGGLFRACFERIVLKGCGVLPNLLHGLTGRVAHKAERSTR